MDTATRLSDHGIHNESSDVRVHVCAGVRRVYSFPTRSGKIAAELHKKDAYFAYQPGVSGPTATGVRVQPDDISGCVELALDERVWKRWDEVPDTDTSVKGLKAQKVVVWMLRRGMLPLPVASVDEIADMKLQHSGTDIMVNCGNRTVRLQVKCDIHGGSAGLGGRGLFLQLSERNPLGRF